MVEVGIARGRRRGPSTVIPRTRPATGQMARSNCVCLPAVMVTWFEAKDRRVRYVAHCALSPDVARLLICAKKGDLTGIMIIKGRRVDEDRRECVAPAHRSYRRSDDRQRADHLCLSLKGPTRGVILVSAVDALNHGRIDRRERRLGWQRFVARTRANQSGHTDFEIGFRGKAKCHGQKCRFCTARMRDFRYPDLKC